MKKVMVLLIVVFSLCGCSTESKLDKIIEENNYIVIDVRTKEEYDEGHIIDSLNIPYDEINESVELDKDKTILVYCRSGNRSGIAYNTLKTLGFDVYDLGAFEEIDLPKE